MTAPEAACGELLISLIYPVNSLICGNKSLLLKNNSLFRSVGNLPNKPKPILNFSGLYRLDRA
jgi:hypothetical protein